MNRRVFLLLPVGLLAAAGIAYATTRTPVPQDLDFALTQVSELGAYAITLTPGTDPIPVGQMHGWFVTVTDAAGHPVEAEVIFDGGMPQHGHGLPTVPKTMGQDAEGRHIIGGVRFNMPGWWELQVKAAGPQGTDHAIFNIAL